MATTQLADAYIADVYDSYGVVDNVLKTEFYEAGIVSRSALLDQVAAAGGKLLTAPFWGDLDHTDEENYSNDDPSDLAVPNKISSLTMVGRKAFVNNGWSAMDLVKELAGSDPMKRIKAATDRYWTKRLQCRLIAICVGVIADNIANDSSDMGVDISALAGTLAVFNRTAVNAAVHTAGEYSTIFTAIAVHSQIHKVMVDNDEIVHIPDSQGKLTIPTYMGLRVIVADALPVSSGVYTSILFGPAAIGFGGGDGTLVALGEGQPRKPSAVERFEREGQGGGSETLWERKTWLLHPAGFSWVEGSLTEFSPQISDLQSATHWNRVFPRQKIPLAWLKSRAVPV